MPAPSLAEFRTMFPAFADTAAYPDALTSAWMNTAMLRVNEQRWGDLYNTGVYLVLAHTLVLDARDQAAAEAGGIPGEMNGSISAKSVDKVSVSYSDTATLPGGGDWNLTTYGVRYKSLARLMGAGGLQL
jgi:hypothetical protein